jgi:CubicO group peptidase (beta-lactamase class C family)
LLERVDELARRAIEEEGIPGLSIAVDRDGELLLAGGWGYADPARGVPASANTSYPIGSLTRQFTAVGILQLAEQGELSLEDDLTRWLPDFPTQGRAVKLRHLLEGTSGLPGYAALSARHAAELDRGVTREQLFALFEELPFEFAPGEGFSPNSSGYLLLSMVLAAASGEDDDDFVRARILEPLDLRSTGFCPREGSLGFAQACKELSDERELEIPLADSGGVSTQSLCSTVGDLVRWERALQDEILLGQASTRLMRTPARLADGSSSSHGFAVAVGETEFSRFTAHSGGIGGFRTRLAFYETPRLTVVVLANCATADVERLEAAITRAALDLLPLELEDQPLDARELGLYTGSWQIATDRVRTFDRDGQLWFEYAVEPAFRLRYQGGHVFVASTDPDLRITFRVLDDKPAESFEILRKGSTSIGLRMN